jgi:hypothetical protein
MGGAKGYDTKWRDFGVPLVLAGEMFLLNAALSWWVWVMVAVLNFAALTTYWDTVFGEDNFYAHGFMCGLGMIPLMMAGTAIFWILLRAAVLAMAFGVVHRYLPGTGIKPGTEDIVEEFTRGAFLALTVPLVV